MQSGVALNSTITWTLQSFTSASAQFRIGTANSSPRSSTPAPEPATLGLLGLGLLGTAALRPRKAA